MGLSLLKPISIWGDMNYLVTGMNHQVSAFSGNINYTGEAPFCGKFGNASARDLEPRSISSKILNDDPPKKKHFRCNVGPQVISVAF